MARLGSLRGVILALVAALVPLGGVAQSAPVASAVTVVPVASPERLQAEAIYLLQAVRPEFRGLVVDTMAVSSPTRATRWRTFLATWERINASMRIYTVAPDGLPTSGHVFVVLGSGLTSSGTITTKLERRLRVTLAALRKYPTSRVLVSGGAPRNGVTEAAVMRSWLIARGIASSRILTESASSSTIRNAMYSIAMLAATPGVRSYTLISDASHLRLATVLFRAATLQWQERAGVAYPVKPRANVAYLDLATAGQGPLRASSVTYAASNVASLLGLSTAYRAVLAAPPATPVLTSLALRPPATTTYVVGHALDKTGMLATARYDGGVYLRRVTTVAGISGFNPLVVGTSAARVGYTDGGVAVSAPFGYTIVKGTSVLRVGLSTTTPTRSVTRVSVKATVTSDAGGIVPTGKVRFYLDGTWLKTVTLTADHAGIARFTYPTIRALGAHRITVKYVGTAQLTSAVVGRWITVVA